MNPQSHPRDNGLARWHKHDYHEAGFYWVTFDVADRTGILGTVVDDRVELSAAGEIVKRHLEQIHLHFAARVDTCVIMPDHVHAIIVLLPKPESPLEKLAAHSLSEVVGALRRFSAKEINKVLGRTGTPVWQRNFYDRVIRDEDELARFRRYCLNNPARWQQGKENPTNNPGM